MIVGFLTRLHRKQHPFIRAALPRTRVDGGGNYRGRKDLETLIFYFLQPLRVGNFFSFFGFFLVHLINKAIIQWVIPHVQRNRCASVNFGVSPIKVKIIPSDFFFSSHL